jgi:hypothetical protein
LISVPTNIQAVASANGAARVSWEPSPRAKSHFVGIWQRTPSRFITGGWTEASQMEFAVGTLSRDVAYDAYVSATNVDLQSSQTPTQVVVAENSYQPVSFVAR